MKKESLLGIFQKVYADYVSDWRRLLLGFPVGTSFLVSSTLVVGVRDEGLNGCPDIFVEDCSAVVGGRCSVLGLSLLFLLRSSYLSFRLLTVPLRSTMRTFNTTFSCTFNLIFLPLVP